MSSEWARSDHGATFLVSTIVFLVTSSARIHGKKYIQYMTNPAPQMLGQTHSTPSSPARGKDILWHPCFLDLRLTPCLRYWL